MTVTFKTLRYGHVIEARELQRRIEQGEASQAESDQYIFNLVDSWDFTDIETGELIPVNKPELLSLDQYTELITEFNDQMAGTKVKKTTAAPSSYTPNGSKRAKKVTTSHAARQTG